MAKKEAAGPKVQLTVSQILNDLRNGIDRNAIKEKYGLTRTEVNLLFKHPQLIGKKVKTAPNFELTDDVTETSASTGKQAKEPVSESKGVW